MEKIKIIVVSGLPGSGKSTLAEAVARELKFALFSVDPIESAIIRSGIKRSFETGLAAYLVTQSLAGEQLKLNNSVIIDAVSPVKEAREMWKELAGKFKAQLIIIECILDEEIHRKRIENRIRNLHGIPEVSWGDVEKRRSEYLPWTEERLIINSVDHVADNLQKTLEYIEQRMN